jgi:hypothetical protein
MRKIIALWILLPVLLSGQKFFPDDPLEREPAPVDIVSKPKSRKVGEYYDFFRATFTKPGERHTPGQTIPAQNVNTLGEVMDGAWYVNRHYKKRMSIPELVRGPGNETPPSSGGPWKITSAKTEGVTPGFNIEDSRGHKYIIKFDPFSNLELATAAEMLGSRFFHALGYHVPEIYIVYFDRKRLVIPPETTVKEAGQIRSMKKRDLDEIFFAVPHDPQKGYRAVASRFIEGKILGHFLYEGTRSDDPNDLVPHEHHRELRGLFVFAAWLGHNDIKCLNTLDSLVQEDGASYIRHYLIDFGASLGSDSFTTKSPRAGYEYLFRWKPTIAQIFSLGLYVPKWARAGYPHFASVGNFEYEVFEPEEWKPNYPATIFDNRLPEDTFWAAKQVMWFTDDEIRAIVETGQYTDPKAVNWLVKCLIERRNKIGRTYFAKVLPLDRFRVENRKLAFEDLGARYDFAPRREYSVEWSRFDNETETHAAIGGGDGFTLPAEIRQAASGSYFAARITADGESKTVTVYLRKTDAGPTIVGIDRTS